MFRKGLIFLSVLLMTMANLAPIKAADIVQGNQLTILLVGVAADELAEYELKVLKGKRIIEIPSSQNWRTTLENTHADEILLKQNSGFVGLYTPGGSLVRAIDLEGGNPYLEKNPLPPDHMQISHEIEFGQIGYSTGGRVDPYQPLGYHSEQKDETKLAPGYGYNSQIDQPKVFSRSSWMDLLNFVPIDVVTPFNYPGTFDQHGIGAAYTLGAIPHIGGAVAEWRKAKADKGNFDYYQQQQPPNHVEYPPVYQRFNSGSPTNPITDDPNFMRYQTMPQAFVREYPSYAGSPQGYYRP